MLNFIKQNAKNMLGWKTRRRLVIISVDDFGNVRLDSKGARERLDSEGLKVFGYFDEYDTLENREDLESLYDALTSVKDRNGRHAVFTPFAVPCNINFEKMAEENYERYHYELLPETYSKLSDYYPASYKGTWELWKEGVLRGLLVPQFHGREHINLKVFEKKLREKDRELLILLKNRSLTGLPRSGHHNIGYSAAFDFWEFKENDGFKIIIEDGLNAFEKVFGYRSVHFNPAGGREHSYIYKFLKENGIKYLDTHLIKKENRGNGKYKTMINYTGKINTLGMVYFVRNVVFEPSEPKSFDWAMFTLKQIETAFNWNQPAIISSHRANYCGHVSPKNRSVGINSLKTLLKEIVRKWPDVEFMSSDELGDLIQSQKADLSEKHHTILG